MELSRILILTHIYLSVGATKRMGNDTEEKLRIKLGLVLPFSNFNRRDYSRFSATSLSNLMKKNKYKFFNFYSIKKEDIILGQMRISSSPTEMLDILCNKLLKNRVSAILYVSNNELYGRNTAASQYFLQLCGYLGIPVVSWNADNSGLEKKFSSSNLQLQLAPNLEHISAAMLSILIRYNWHQFSIVTSEISGNWDFVQVIREKCMQMQDQFKFNILNTVKVKYQKDLEELRDSEARIMLLYSTREEAKKILSYASHLGLTGKNYLWIATQSVLADSDPPAEFPVGMLGIHFDTSANKIEQHIFSTLEVFAHAMELYVMDGKNEIVDLGSTLSCDEGSQVDWPHGETLYGYLRNVVVGRSLTDPGLRFDQDGNAKAMQLHIMNLRPGARTGTSKWEAIGTWNSTIQERNGLDIKDIIWPGHSAHPPEGVPEKFHLKITFLEEPPYVILSPPDPKSGKCTINRGVHCRVKKEDDYSNIANWTEAHKNSSLFQCCSGFCIDLLEKLAEEVGFSYDLIRQEDEKWGTLVHGKWNGLIDTLVRHKADMVVTALKINSDREAYIDFTVPFLETGISIVVSKRTGIISPTAFLEPFDSSSWMLVALVSIQASALSIFIFEWLSPSGYDMKLSPNRETKFSLLRAYWLVFAALFQAAVNVDCPRGYTAKFMSNVWAMFAVVFLAIYTANLAAFMITREEYYDIKGIEDTKLVNPYFTQPPFRFGTIPYGNTEAVLSVNYPKIYSYMKQLNRTTVAEGLEAIRKGELDAFIYDATVLDYLVGQDPGCKLLTVGDWFAMTGYGFGFPRGSKHLKVFNKKLMEYQDNGDIERLGRFWLRALCVPGKQRRSASNPLSLEQFLSAFLLLLAGIVLASLFLLCEHFYFRYIRRHLAKRNQGGCCALMSLSMGRSLIVQDPHVQRLDPRLRQRCRDPYCDTKLWKMQHELELARGKVVQLEKELIHHGIQPPGEQGHCCNWLSWTEEDEWSYVRDNSPSNQLPMNRTAAYMIKSQEFPKAQLYSDPIKRKFQEVAEIETVL